MVTPLLSVQQTFAGLLPDDSTPPRPRARLAQTSPAKKRLAHTYPTKNLIVDRYLPLLSDKAPKVYAYLKRWADRSNPQDLTEPCERGYGRIAKDLRLGRRTVMYAMQELEYYGLIACKKRQGFRGTNHYTFPIPPQEPKPRWQRPTGQQDNPRLVHTRALVTSAHTCTSLVHTRAPNQGSSQDTTSLKGEGEAVISGDTRASPPALTLDTIPPPSERVCRHRPSPAAHPCPNV